MEEYKAMTNAELNQKRKELHEEEQTKNDIIVMKHVKVNDDRYVFYLIGRQNQLVATLDEIDQMAKYHHAKVSYFPTSDPVIANIRKLLKTAEPILFAETEEYLELEKECAAKDHRDLLYLQGENEELKEQIERLKAPTAIQQ